MVSSIITNKWHNERKPNFVEESQQFVIAAAAKPIKAEIRESFTVQQLGLPTDFCNVQAAKDWIGLLKELIENIVFMELK